MKLSALLIVFTFFCAVAAEATPMQYRAMQQQQAGGLGVNITLLNAVKKMSRSDWKQTDASEESALRIDFGRPSWFGNFVIDLYDSRSEDLTFVNGTLTDVELTTEETRLGFRFYRGNMMRLFLGAGLADIAYRYEAVDASSAVSESGSTGFTTDSYWWEVGIDAQFTPFVIGFVYGQSNGEANINGADREVGGTHSGLYFGISF